MHGGLSTGPKTAEGKERIRRANWKHGRHAKGARERAMTLGLKELAKMRQGLDPHSIAEAIVKFSRRRGALVRLTFTDPVARARGF